MSDNPVKVLSGDEVIARWPQFDSSCDWGECDELSVGYRNDVEDCGWLLVCQKHYDEEPNKERVGRFVTEAKLSETAADEAPGKEVLKHREHLDDDLKKIAEMGRAIESYPWLMRERDLHRHIDALCATVRALRESLRAAVASIKVNDHGQPLDRACPWSLDWYATASAMLNGQSFDPQPQYEKGFEAGTAFAKSTIEDLQSENTALREQLVQSQTGYQRATIGLSNLYHVITNERCDDAVALGMATSAVGSLIRQRDELKAQLAQVTQERQICAKCRNEVVDSE